MKFRTHRNHLGFAVLMLALAACSGGGISDGGESPPPPPPPPPTQPPPPPVVGAAGGTVLGPNGAKVEIPPGALTVDTPIAIELSSAGVPALPGGFVAFGQMFAFTPHGTTFAVPVTVTLPYDLAARLAGTTPTLYKTNGQNQWEHVATATFKADSLSAKITSFSDFTAVIPPLTPSDDLIRLWSFSEFRTDALEEVEVAGGVQIGGNLEEFFDFGPAAFDPAFLDDDGSELPADGIATGDIVSTADGVTYWVGTSAPREDANFPDSPLGSKAELVQIQSYIKNAADATYRFTLTFADVEVWDGNSVLGRACPPGRELSLGACDLIKAEVYLEVFAFVNEPDPDDPDAPLKTRDVYRASGGASLNGGATVNELNDSRINWVDTVWNDASALTPLWTEESFGITRTDFNGRDGHVLMELGNPRTYNVDLSSIDEGQEFHVWVTTHASTYNRAALGVSGVVSEFQTAANAFLRDPSSIGGTTVTTTGLTRIATPALLERPIEALAPPAPCVPGPGPDPAAGVLQFSAESYTLAETSTTPTITVTRTGGSRGAVTATFATSDGTAIGGTDYTPANATVFFADGDAVPRVVRVPIIQDVISAEPDKTVNLALSQPGGCAALGAQTTALLTIRDDDPLPALPSRLDPSFGTQGKATTTAFGGDRSAMALQPDGKIVMVGGTFADFILARFDADGSPDESFDADGKVTTDMVNGEQEEALGVAIQPDGKIVVVGYTGTAGPGGPSNFALARYDANGVLDASFGSGGKVTTGVFGRAFAVAIQVDGADIKVVVAGDNPDAEDFVLARYNANGSLDTSFGSGGQITTDIANGAELAGNLVLQSNGAILISGPHTNAGEATRDQHTALARYDRNGNPDSSFGVGGELVLSNARVGEGLALQGDGKIVLVGNAGVGVNTSFALMRLEPNGEPDDEFGSAGTVITPVSGLGDAALAVALQSDGRIVVAGRSSSQTNSNFAVARYSVAGVLDTGFGNAGTLIIDFFGFTDIAESLAVQPDGKIVLGGLARDNVDGYGLARVLP